MENLKQFTEKVLKGVNEKVGNEFRVSITESMKNNGNKLTGISAVPYGRIGGPCVYLDRYYKEYENGGITFSEIVDGVYSQIMSHKDDIRDFNAACLLDWNVAKKHIYMKLVNAEKNKELLRMAPHRIFLDLAVVYYIEANDVAGGQGVCSIMIYGQHMSIWGKDEEKLYEAAIHNMRSNGMPVFESIGGILNHLVQGNLSALESGGDPMDGMYVLTNQRKCYGASEILDKNTLKEISNKLGGDFIALPSSIHEVIILPMEGWMKYKELASIVREVNATEVGVEEYLSDHVYVYEQGNGSLAIAA